MARQTLAQVYLPAPRATLMAGTLHNVPTVVVRTGANWADGLEAEWDALLASCSGATPFQSRAWMTTWWEHFGRGREPHVIESRENGVLVGLFPLVRCRGPWSALRPMGVGPSDYLAPLGVIHGELKGALIDLHQAPYAPAAATIEHAKCLQVDLPASFDAYLARLSKSLRYDVRRMDKIADLEFCRDLNPDASLDILFELHQRRWRARGLPGAFVGRIKRFHRDWLTRCGDMAKVTVLRWRGKPVGAIYTMHLHGVTYFYQAGFDPDASAISPGTLLVGQAIREAIERGDHRFDFCRGDEPYKRRWKPDRVVVNYRLMDAHSALGRLGLSWNCFAWAIEAKLRQRLEGGTLFPTRPRPARSEPA